MWFMNSSGHDISQIGEDQHSWYYAYLLIQQLQRVKSDL